ncbi:cobalt ABC transporter permease [Geomonas sp. Red51]|uniref:cobalt ABC transporter permease n=1 Tax=Geomonas azotofigens TaxID=2843196 RepID=UPI001C11368F|nr:cobalt ABC transporter permease [Geomonas azotofigens]
MPDRKRRWKVLLLHTVMLPTLLFAFYFFSLAPKSYQGVDEAVVEKIAKEHGREAKAPIIDLGSGDLLLFAFLGAGVIGGFLAGYYWRQLTGKDHKEG